jgi:hypothetical protein
VRGERLLSIRFTAALAYLNSWKLMWPVSLACFTAPSCPTIPQPHTPHLSGCFARCGLPKPDMCILKTVGCGRLRVQGCVICTSAAASCESSPCVSLSLFRVRCCEPYQNIRQRRESALHWPHFSNVTPLHAAATRAAPYPCVAEDKGPYWPTKTGELYAFLDGL